MNSKKRNFLTKMVVAGAGALALMTTLEARGGNGNGGKRRPGNGDGLTAAQLDELFFIYQEEKLARDVYITLGEMYPGENTFATIQHSEQRHIDSAEMLCNDYNIDLSEVNEDQVGNFVLPILQGYYNKLVLDGSESLKAALEVGVFVEELDIADLTEAIDTMDMPDKVVRVYENLREGSYNHLEAFQGALTRA